MSGRPAATVLAAVLSVCGTAAAAGGQSPADGAPPHGRCAEGGRAPGWGWALEALPVADAVRRIAQEAGWRLSFSEAALPTRRVSVRCRTFEAIEALTVVLRGATVRAEFRGALVILAPVAGGAGDGGRDGARAQPLPVTRVEADRTAGPGWELAVPAAPAGTGGVRLRMDSLRARGIVTLGEALRGAIPGLVTWDRGGGSLRIASVRGRGVDGGPGVKVFVDGLEVADPSALLAGDTRTVASMEWLPGPAGAALYGSDALDGVLLVRTRADEGGRDAGDAARWTATVRGGRGAARYRPGDVRTGDAAATVGWRDGDPAPASGGGGVRRTASATASVQWSDVPVPADPVGTATAAMTATVEGARWQVALTARGGAGRQRLAFLPEELAPEGARPGGGAPSALDEERLRDAQLGVSGWHRGGRLRQAWSLSAAHASREAWSAGTRASLQDSLRGAWQGPVTRQAARYAATLPLGRTTPRTGEPEGAAPLPVTLQLSADGAALRRTGPDSLGFANSLGDSTVVQSAAGAGALFTGVAGPVRWSAGVRGEWNSAFGSTARVAWLPTVGGVLRRGWGGNGWWSVRAATGASLRAPQPVMTAARTTSVFVQRGNASLAGERLRGAEVGAALERGRWALDATAFRQRTDGFTQLVSLGQSSVPGEPRREVQYRTVGVLLAEGVEVRARHHGAWGAWEGSASANRSRLRSLAPDYRGPLSVGAPPLEAPQGTLAASWSRPLLGGRVAVTMSRLGAWQTHLVRCPGAPAARGCDTDLVQRVEPLSRWQASYGRALAGGWQWRVRGENLTNTQRADGSALLVAPGLTLAVEVGRW